MKQELKSEKRWQEETTDEDCGDPTSWLASLHANAAERWLKSDPPRLTEAALSLRMALDALCALQETEDRPGDRQADEMAKNGQGGSVRPIGQGVYPINHCTSDANI